MPVLFGDRLLYVGLQGSYLRGEASENSDIDVMVVLDRLSVGDMDAYRRILERIGDHERSCGFICGKEELLRWNPSEVTELLYGTKDLVGVLSDFLPEATRTDEINYINLSLGNLYHALCHRYIHADRERNAAAFRGTAKGLFYLIRHMHYLESGTFAPDRRTLKAQVSEKDRAVLEAAEQADGYDFDAAFAAVIEWCQAAFIRIDQLSERAR